MNVIKAKDKLKEILPEYEFNKLFRFEKLRKIQNDALKILFSEKNLIVSAPTASGKTWIAELFSLYAIFHNHAKVVYTVPLKALANEKYREFKEFKNIKVGISTGDFDATDNFLKDYNLIITTCEKLDSLIRHNAIWLDDVKLLVVDEIHMINDASRGSVVEMVVAYFYDKARILGLSATISNANELAEWLKADLIKSNERPVKLKYGALKNNVIYFD